MGSWTVAKVVARARAGARAQTHSEECRRILRALEQTEVGQERIARKEEFQERKKVRMASDGDHAQQAASAPRSHDEDKDVEVKPATRGNSPSFGSGAARGAGERAAGSGDLPMDGGGAALARGSSASSPSGVAHGAGERKSNASSGDASMGGAAPTRSDAKRRKTTDGEIASATSGSASSKTPQVRPAASASNMSRSASSMTPHALPTPSGSASSTTLQVASSRAAQAPSSATTQATASEGAALGAQLETEDVIMTTTWDIEEYEGDLWIVPKALSTERGARIARGHAGMPVGRRKLSGKVRLQGVDGQSREVNTVSWVREDGTVPEAPDYWTGRV